MKIILLKDVANVGDEGDVREVADGFARNLLFPQHLAVPATDEAARVAAQRAAARRQEAERELHNFQALAERLDGYEVTIKAAVTPGGGLYGSVNAAAVAQALREAGFAVEDAQVALPEPIKETGEQEVYLRFPHGLEAKATVIVEPEE